MLRKNKKRSSVSTLAFQIGLLSFLGKGQEKAGVKHTLIIIRLYLNSQADVCNWLYVSILMVEKLNVIF